MLLMQEPQLLLLDEPVAGMTDEETERTAELFLSLAASIRWSWSSTTWSSSAASRARSRCCTRAACSPKAAWTTVQNDQRVIEVYLGR